MWIDVPFLEKMNCKKSLAKNFKNCTNIPIICDENDKEIIYSILTPELYLIIGISNILYKHMLSEFEKDSLHWAKKCNQYMNVRPKFQLESEN